MTSGGLTVGWRRETYAPSGTCITVTKDKGQFLKAERRGLVKFQGTDRDETRTHGELH
jgi:hypothetical protein